MQAAYLISAKGFTEKEMGVLFLVFGLSQFLCMTPAGYYLDYSNNKINWVIWASILTSLLTVVTVLTADEGGGNMGLMIFWKALQGAITAILPPGFNGITLGIVGSTGFTYQVSRNRMMNHLGTALVVAIGSMISYTLYPNIGALFIVSPLATIGVYYNLARIQPTHVDRDAARALIIESPTMTEYEHLDTQGTIDEYENLGDDSDSSNSNSVPGKGDATLSERSDQDQSYRPPAVVHEQNASPHVGGDSGPVTLLYPHSSRNEGPIVFEAQPGTSMGPKVSSFGQDTSNTSTSAGHVRSYASGPSFNFGWGRQRTNDQSAERPPQASTPLAVLRDPVLVIFTLVVFFFHLANSAVLPLVMQSLAVQDAQSGILLSGLCILIGQTFMSYFAKVCGDYSPKWGRKGLIVAALASLTVRCFMLTILLSAQEKVETARQSYTIDALILSTQLLDSVGAGIFGTLHILVTNDISCKTGRFSLMLGLTTAAMCLGATISGYIGQAIAQDHGYSVAFTSLGVMSLIPLFMYMFCMPETLPDFAKPKQRRRRLLALLRRLNEHRRKLAIRANPFRRKKKNSTANVEEVMAQGLDPKPQSSGTPTDIELV